MSTDAERVRRRLWALADLHAADFGFATNCKDLVRQFIDGGVATLDGHGFADSRSRLGDAEHNLRRLIDEMIEEARLRGWDELHEDTFFAARNKLCPAWPFC